MFGYVTPLKGELKIKEFNLFKAYYCGLCLHIKKHFGNLPRMTLNYDMTFLALLLDGLEEKDPNVELKRCMTHPTSKKPMILENKALSYSANMNVALVYYKLLDDAWDDKSIKTKFSSLLLLPYKNSFTSNLTGINEIIEKNLQELYTLEKNNSFNSLDEICHPFSHIVGSILKLYPENISNDSLEKRELLYSFGYSLGKWIYLIDALDDLEDDMKNNKFNPINILFNKDNLTYEALIENIKDRLEFSIFCSGSRLKEILELLDLKRNKEILLNIIELGMVDKYYAIFKKDCNCKNKKGSEFSHESI